MSPHRILMIATSADRMDNGEPTGLWIDELTAPYYAFTDAGAEVTLASIRGGAIPIDPRSMKPKGENDETVERYLDDADLQALAKNTPAFETLADQSFDAIFLPGGHGTMFDYPGNRALAELLGRTFAAGRVVSAVCHGPAGLVNVKAPDGEPLVKGRTVAGFTDSEERAAKLDHAVPFLLETRLKALGANYVSGPDYEPFAVRDGLLVTGQNPASAAKTAALVMEALSSKAEAA